MAVLQHLSTGRRATLSARCVIGRAPASGICLDDDRVSAEHATIFWHEGLWFVRDLGSSNGTRVDGQALAVGERVALAPGARIEFGSAAQAWSLADDLPPVASARSSGTGHVEVAERGLLALPSADQVRLCVFLGSDGVWWLEDPERESTRPARDQERIDLGESEGAWILQIPSAGAEGGVVTTRKRTRARPRSLRASMLRFEVSRDEEHIELFIDDGSDVLPLGARAHNELLATLARRRLADRQLGELPEAEEGWLYVDELERMLACDLPQLNMLVFRARQQLAGIDVVDAGQLIERRLSTRQIRLGTARVSILHH